MGFWARVMEWANQPPRSGSSSFVQPRIGLALGGGFARGMAHLGVLQVLQENGIPIHAIAGSSAGAIVAAAWAGGRNVEEMIAGTQSLRFRDFGAWTISRWWFASNERMERFLTRCFPSKRFSELRIPVAVVATDLLTGKPLVFRDGDVVGPIRASCAYPGLFEPVELGGRRLIDGAFSMPVPAQLLRTMGCTHVIAVNISVGPQGSLGPSEPSNMLHVIHHCFGMLQRQLGGDWRRESNVIIEPDMSGLSWDNFSKSREMVEAGAPAARAMLPEIQKLLQSLPAQLPNAKRERYRRHPNRAGLQSDIHALHEPC